jgi:hypothetical protein
MESMLRSSNSNAYGTVPVLPTSDQLGTSVLDILNKAIPNFSNLVSGASNNIASSTSGTLSPDVQDLLARSAASQAVAGGMPGTSNISGSLYGNKSLRDLGITSTQRQDQGLSDLIKLLSGISGNVTPNVAQTQEQENARAKYAAAPDPQEAVTEQERLFDKYSNPALGTISGGSNTPSNPMTFYSARLGRMATPQEIYGL